MKATLSGTEATMTKVKKDVRMLRNYNEHLTCKLTDAELRERGAQLAATIEDQKAEESKQEDMKRQMKSALSSLEARRDVLALAVSRRAETREVEVQEMAYDSTGMVEKVRMDTGEVIGRRKMTASEQQTALAV